MPNEITYRGGSQPGGLPGIPGGGYASGPSNAPAPGPGYAARGVDQIPQVGFNPVKPEEDPNLRNYLSALYQSRGQGSAQSPMHAAGEQGRVIRVGGTGVSGAPAPPPPQMTVGYNAAYGPDSARYYDGAMGVGQLPGGYNVNVPGVGTIPMDVFNRMNQQKG